MVKEHSLKCWPQFMPRIASGQKTFEIRKNDRDFQVGDIIRLYEYNPKTLIQWASDSRHKDIIAEITYISTFMQKEDYVVMGIKLIQEARHET